MGHTNGMKHSQTCVYHHKNILSRIYAKIYYSDFFKCAQLKIIYGNCDTGYPTMVMK